MKTMKYTTMILAAALLFSLGGCVKDELFITTHPGSGKISVTADWSDRGEEVDIPADWTISMGDYTGSETGATHSPDYLFNPGSYTLVAYSPADGISVNGTTATAADAGNGFITGTPGWLFSSVQEITVEADTDHTLTADMHQQVRELTLMIEPEGDAADRIETIEGTLSGAAGTLDFATGVYGSASDVELHFSKITEGDNAGKWTATVRLLGITGDAQTLTATLTYTDGNPQPESLYSDLTVNLNGFNDDKTTPSTLGGTVAETPTEAGFSATIDDWQPVTEGPIDVK